MNGTSPRQRWREFPPTPAVDGHPVDAEHPKEVKEVEEARNEGAGRRKSLLAAGFFGFAALVIGLLSILLVNREDGSQLPAEVAGVIQTTVVSTSASTSPTTTVDSTVDTSVASTEAPTIAPELAELASQVGALELTLYVNDELVSGETLSFAVRIFNPSAAEIPVDALDVAATIGGVPVERITFLSQHATIPADDSAVGTVRVAIPEAVRPMEMTVSIGGIELGRAPIG